MLMMRPYCKALNDERAACVVLISPRTAWNCEVNSGQVMDERSDRESPLNEKVGKALLTTVVIGAP
jgi:hypothetical protein